MMKILITGGLAARDIGGPSQYGPNLLAAFQKLGHQVSLVTFGPLEKFLPVGIRHLYFFLKIIPKILWADYILTLDAFSAGAPTVLASSLFGKNKKSIARIGGDYLWSAYVNRTETKLTLREFYENLPRLSIKERIILKITKWFIKTVGFLAFNTRWQEKMWRSFYKIGNEKTGVVINFIPKRQSFSSPPSKEFIWAGRSIAEKNLEVLKSAAERFLVENKSFRLNLITDKSREETQEAIKNCYAVVSSALTDICPNFVIEGISFNKPFIVTKETGLLELYPKGGIFVDPKNEEAWVNAFRIMMDDKNYNNFLRELRDLNLEHSWEEMAGEYINIWRKI